MRALASCVLLGLSLPAAADTIVLPLNEATIPDTLECEQPWTLDGIELEVVPLEVQECGLSLCLINLATSTTSLQLVPGRLEVDLTAVPGTVQAVGAIVGCPAFAQPLRVYDGDVLVASALTEHAFPPDTVSVSTGGVPVTRMGWEPCLESLVEQVLIWFDPAVTAAPRDHAAAVPGDRLLAPRPNPLRSNGTLRFVLVRAARVGLSVHDVTGRVVRSFDSEHAAGPHEIAFDGRDDDGAPLPAGVYFQRLAVNGRDRAATKLVLLR